MFDYTKRKRIKGQGTSILQYDLEGNFIREWNSMIEASQVLQISRPSISNCCRGKQKSLRKFQWKYKTENYPLKIDSLKNNDFDIHRRTKQIICLDTGEIFNSIKEVCEKYKVDKGNVVKVCKGIYNQTGNLKFRYL